MQFVIFTLQNNILYTIHKRFTVCLDTKFHTCKQRLINHQCQNEEGIRTSHGHDVLINSCICLAIIPDYRNLKKYMVWVAKTITVEEPFNSIRITAV